MTAQQRRDELLLLLKNATAPLSASLIAETFGVSRQIIVGDVALLRAANVPIVATPRGYIVQADNAKCTYNIACKHERERLLQELYIIVDCGCAIIDVTVEHAVYGQISGGLHVHSRYDADLFWQRLNESEALPLSSLTGDAHLHAVSCPSKQHFDTMCQELDKHGFLVK